ncbi:MAG: hypothetical protein LBJ93_01990 [Clostridiales bacterium]|jgi:hypothetical protein|nr:hypothetical protein [Clostridiales bacterium]
MSEIEIPNDVNIITFLLKFLQGLSRYEILLRIRALFQILNTSSEIQNKLAKIILSSLGMKSLISREVRFCKIGFPLEELTGYSLIDESIRLSNHLLPILLATSRENSQTKEHVDSLFKIAY